MVSFCNGGIKSVDTTVPDRRYILFHTQFEPERYINYTSINLLA